MALYKTTPTIIPTTCNLHRTKITIKTQFKIYDNLQRITKTHVYCAIRNAISISKKSSNIDDIIAAWDIVDDLTLKYYDDNNNSIEDIADIYTLTKEFM
jgi:hypothetical protein